MTDQVSISNWPLPPSFRQVLVVGGTFDPPHSAHVRMVANLRDARYPDAAILFVPAAVSPFKTEMPATDPALRAQMISLAAREVPAVAVWTDEIDRARQGEPSYMIDTLRRLKAVAPDVRPVLVIGSDQAAAFHRWREARSILAIADVAVLPRAPISNARELCLVLDSAGYWNDAEVGQWGERVVNIELNDISSTRIREGIVARGIRSIDSQTIDPEVARFIDEHGLYRRA